MFIKRKILVLTFAIAFVLTQMITANPVFAQSTGTDRISGDDRYKTAVAVSQKGWKTAEYAVLARGDDFADALCAGPLAQKYNGPILLTPSNQLNSETLEELIRLGVQHVFIAGGTGAVSRSVEDSLKANGFSTIERIYGNDRYQTSVKIAEKIGASNKVVLATGNNFPDALSISSIAAKLGMPILLTAKDSLPASVNSYMESNSVTQTYIVGGTEVISTKVENNVRGVSRLAGSNRYETNQVILQYFADQLNFENIYVAVGSQFADALTGAVLAAKTSSPLVLTGNTLPAVTNNYLQTKLKLSTKVKGLGGKNVVPSSVLTGLSGSKENISVEEKYSTAGSYGPQTGTETIEGSVIISARDVTLRNMIIKGDLLLGQSIGDGNVHLNNVTVEGKTIINGGGPNSIIMFNFYGINITVDVPDGSSVRLVAQGSTSVTNVSMEGNGTLQESGLTGTGFINIAIPTGAQVTLDGTFDQVNVEASGASVNVTSGNVNTMNIAENATGSGVNLANGTSVGTLNANAPSTVTGDGQITTAVVNTNNVSIEQTPANIMVASGVTVEVDGEQQTGTSTTSPTSGGDSGGGGGGGDGTAPTVNTYSPADNATNIAINANLVLTFSENVQAVAGKNIVIKKTTDNSTAATIAANDAKVTVNAATVTINPADDLLNDTEYYVLIDTGAFRDASANNYAGISSTTAWSFRTAAALSNNAGLTSVAAQTDGTPGAQSGADAGNAIAWEVNVANAKATLARADIAAAANATFHLYSNANFTDGEVTGVDTLNLAVGNTTAYIKVTAQDTTTVKYYAVTITRAASLYGSGTELDPWKISKIEDLASISKNHAGAGSAWELDDYYILMNNLDFNDDASYNDPTATGTDWNGNGSSAETIKVQFTTQTGWIPIGTDGAQFTGHFDGNGKSISNLFINRPDNGYQGLFGAIKGAVINELGLENVNITGEGDTGALAGDAINSTITLCYSTGSITSDYSYVGGLVGWLGNEGMPAGSSTLTKSYSKVNITGTDSASSIGGLVGDAVGSYSSCTISACYASGTIISNTGDAIGGLIGQAGQQVVIDNCYATGAVTGANQVGGLLGNAWNIVSVTDCYAIGNVTGVDGVGGLVGQSHEESANGLSMLRCIAYNTTVTGTTNVHRILGKIFATAWGDTSLGSNYAKNGTGATNDQDGAVIASMTVTGSSPLSAWDFTEDNVDGDGLYWKVADSRPVLYVLRDGAFLQLGDDAGNI